MESLATSAPVNFVYRTAFDEDEARRAPSIDDFLARVAQNRFLFAGTRADLNMIALTYFRLAEAGVGSIRLVREPVRDGINIVHSHHLAEFGPDAERFCVCVQGDYPARPWAQFHILQNEDQLRCDAAVIWLWPQPGLIPRDLARTRFERVGYLGQLAGNLAKDRNYWQQLLEPLNLKFVTREPDAWHDFSDLDAVIGVRSFGRSRYRSKPPSKLVNAWMAGVPFIGGTDSAFAQVGRPGEDYLRITTPAELTEALSRLRHDTSLRQTLVENGRQRARSFSVPNLVERWRALLEGPVETRYRHWVSRARSERLRLYALGTVETAFRTGKAAIRRAGLR